MADTSQPGPRNEMAAVRVSKAEKDALRLVSALKETTESALLRDHTIAEIVEEARGIRESASAGATT